MNKVGIQEAIDIAEGYFSIKISKEWLLENLDEINTFFPAEDDDWFLEEYAGEEVWWTFTKECENRSISDTSPRETYAEALANILTGAGWPVYVDGTEVTDKFYDELKKKCDEIEGLEYLN